jgi:uncharacterized protein YbjT (DUF2867 family)
MFTIFGATGNTGSVVAQSLLAQGKKVRVVGRDATKLASFKGAETVVGDVSNAAIVARALVGAEGAYLLLPPDNGNADLIAHNKRITANYLAGLAAAKVPHVVVLSSVGGHLPSGTGPIVTAHNLEVALAEAGQNRTVIRAAYFMENLLANAHPMKADGVLPVFGGGEGYPFPMIATRDIGETAAAALLAASAELIELAGPKEYSFNDAAAEASTILGRAVKAVAVPLDQVVPTLTRFGFSQNVATLYLEMTEAFGKGLTWDGKGRRVHGRVTLGEVLRAGLTK